MAGESLPHILPLIIGTTGYLECYDGARLHIDILLPSIRIRVEEQNAGNRKAASHGLLTSGSQVRVLLGSPLEEVNICRI